MDEAVLASRGEPDDRRTHREWANLLQALRHDLRTPITKVKMFADLLVERLAPEIKADVLAEIDKLRGGADRAAAIVGELARRIPESSAATSRLEEAIDSLCARIARSLRGEAAFLDAAQGSLRGRLQGRVDARIEEYLAVLERSVRSIVDWTAGLESYAALGLDPIPAGELDLAGIVAVAATAARPQCERRGGSVEIELGSPTMAMGVAQRFAFLFRELFANAIRSHSPDRPPRIRVLAQTDHERVLVRIEDEGSGIASESLPYALDLCHRVGRDAPARPGIGLAACRRIVESAGGRIELANLGAAGTCVTLTLVPGTSGSREV